MLFSINICAQSYKVVSAEVESPDRVNIKIMVYEQNKKLIDKEASLDAIRCLLFDGIPNSRYSSPLLKEGEETMKSKHPSYFNNLYGGRYTDFIFSSQMETKFRKGDDKKGTLYTICVKAQTLRRDVESNYLRNSIGY